MLSVSIQAAENFPGQYVRVNERHTQPGARSNNVFVCKGQQPVANRDTSYEGDAVCDGSIATTRDHNLKVLQGLR